MAQHVAEGMCGRAQRSPQQMGFGLVRNPGKQRLLPHHDEAPWLLIDGARRLNRGADQRPDHHRPSAAQADVRAAQGTEHPLAHSPSIET